MALRYNVNKICHSLVASPSLHLMRSTTSLYPYCTQLKSKASEMRAPPRPPRKLVMTPDTSAQKSPVFHQTNSIPTGASKLESAHLSQAQSDIETNGLSESESEISSSPECDDSNATPSTTSQSATEPRKSVANMFHEAMVDCSRTWTLQK